MAKDVAFPVQKLTGEADGAVTIHRFVKQSGLGTGVSLYAQLAVQGARVDGVSIKDADTGDSFAVANKGVVLVETAGAFTDGDWLMTSANGRSIAHTPGNATVGRAKSSSAGAGELVGVELQILPDSIA